MLAAEEANPSEIGRNKGPRIAVIQRLTRLHLYEFIIDRLNSSILNQLSWGWNFKQVLCNKLRFT